MSERMLWSFAGAVLASGLAALAWFRASRSDPERNFYGFDRTAQLRYAGIFASIATGCAAALFIPIIPPIVLLGVLALAGTLYGASFARGAVDENEP